MEGINLIYNMGVNIYLCELMYILHIEKAGSSVDIRDMINLKMKMTRLTYSAVNESKARMTNC